MIEKASKQRILIVDDAPGNIKILAQTLKSDYHISFATNGADAIRIATTEPCDLILLDIIMPDMDGYDVCSKLKNEESTSNIPIIFITSMNEEEDETRGLELGAVDYIIKPFSMAIVKARVRTHLKLKQLIDTLHNLTCMDGLTSIPNRRRFDEVLEYEWRRSIREVTPLSLIMIDIDRFKDYNDHYGHLAGDDTLRQVATTLAETVQRPMDFVARYGGEEFSAILPRTDIKGATFVADTMRKKIESLNIPHVKSSFSDRITISLGISSVIPTNEIKSDDLIKIADQALYWAKKEGRNRTRCIDLNDSV